MEWWIVLIIAIASLGVGIAIGIGCFELGQMLYYKKLGATTQVGTIKRGENFDKESQLLAEQNADIDTIFVGDSMTEQYDIAKFFKNKNYLNRGIGFNFTLQVLDRLQPQVLLLKPKRIVLLIGTNDLYFGYRPTQIAEHIQDIIVKAKTTLPTVKMVIQQVVPLNESMSPDLNRTNNNIALVNQLLVNVCKDTDSQLVNSSKDLIDQNGQLIKKYTVDGLHLNDDGYQILTNCLKKNVENL
ncbi:MAG: GDSL-type esterase/lipase family protein [Clostridia bacterium]